MVIDKTTGKGCAQSILSKTITRKLVAEGIAGKSIFGKGYYWYQVVGHGENDMYVMLKTDTFPMRGAMPQGAPRCFVSGKGGEHGHRNVATTPSGKLPWQGSRP